MKYFSRNWGKLSRAVAPLILAAVMLMAIGGTSCEQETKQNEVQATLAAESTPIEVQLSISKPPALNEAAELTYTVISTVDAPNSAAEITLPDGATLVSGDLTWQGELKADKPISITAEIVFEETGNWAIRAAAKSVIDENNSWSDVDYIYLNVGDTHGTMGPVYPPGEKNKVKLYR